MVHTHYEPLISMIGHVFPHHERTSRTSLQNTRSMLATRDLLTHACGVSRTPPKLLCPLRYSSTSIVDDLETIASWTARYGVLRKLASGFK